MSLRPDLVECWVFRNDPATGGLEVLLLRRARHRIFPGLWQCVTGGIEPGERVPAAAMREVEEETGLGAADIEAFYDLDQMAPFYDEGSDGVVVSAIFAVRVRSERYRHAVARARCPALGGGARRARRGRVALLRRVRAPGRRGAHGSRARALVSP